MAFKMGKIGKLFGASLLVAGAAQLLGMAFLSKRGTEFDPNSHPMVSMPSFPSPEQLAASPSVSLAGPKDFPGDPHATRILAGRGGLSQALANATPPSGALFDAADLGMPKLA